MFKLLIDPDGADSAQERQLFWRIVLLSMLVKLGFATFLPMGVDEAYATAVAREFSWSFFDHPPLGFWSPVVAAKLSGIEHPFIYRLPVLVYGLISTFLMYVLGRELGGGRAGLWTLVLYVISPAFLLAGGLMVLPDGPLELGSILCALYLVRVVKAGDAADLRLWMMVGVGLAIALASKYQAGLIPIAALVFAIVSPVGRGWFRQPGAYLAALIGLIGLLPTLVWNMQNDWASFAFHSGRTGDGLQLDNFAQMILGQALYLLPTVFVLAMIGLWRGFFSGRPEVLLMAVLAAAPVLMFNIVFLFSDSSFPHWTFPGWQFALPLAGLWLAGAGPVVAARAVGWLIWAGGIVWAVLLVALVHITTGALTRWLPGGVPAWDQTQTVFDYSGLADGLQARGLSDGVDVILVPHWIEAGLLSTGLGGAWPVRVLSRDSHHFQFMSGAVQTGQALLLDVSLLAQSGARGGALLETGRGIDPGAVLLEPVVLTRGGVPYVAVSVVRLQVLE
ncbi:MAG: glycosyltransferase family 39 protein [Paracoccaceae bacterium]